MYDLDKMNEMLFTQLERLSRTDLTEKELNVEIDRAKAMAIVSSQMISSSTLQMRQKFLANGQKMIEG